MDVFRVRQQLIDDYSTFTAAFVDVRDRRIAAHVGERLRAGAQWPDPSLRTLASRLSRSLPR